MTTAADLQPGTVIRLPFSLNKVGPNHSVAAGRKGTVLGTRPMSTGNISITVQVGRAMRTFQLPLDFDVEVA